MIICFIKLCLLLSGDIEQHPGPTQGDTTRTLQSSISICHLNIRSLRNKIDDIVHIVEDFDIVCFTETHFDQRVPTNNLVIPGFPFKRGIIMIPTINNNICEIMIANSTIYWNSSRLNNSD
jgi:hypothetical protein